ncbi:MAG: response regulator [Pseudonocardiaceae bacterium]
MTADSVQILLADDHTLLREAMRDLLMSESEFRVVGEAADGEAVVQQAARLRPHVLLLDIEMPNSRAPETVRRIRSASPMTKVVVLSMHEEPPIIREMLESGVSGYLHKSVSKQSLVAAIRAVHHADRSAGRQVVISVSQELLTHEPVPSSELSAREREVLTLVATALSNRQISSQLSITEATVKRHLRNVFEKLGAVSRIDAVNKATAASLIQR